MYFNGLDNYRKQYVKWIFGTDNSKIPVILNNKKIGEYGIPYRHRNKYIKMLDLSQPDLIYRDNPYTRFANDVWKKQYLIIDSDRIKKDYDARCIHMNDRNYEIVNKFYGIGTERKSKAQLSKEYGVTESRLEQILAEVAWVRAREAGCPFSYKTPILLDIDRENEIVDKYFEKHDIFDNGTVGTIDDNLKDEIRKLVEIGESERKERDKNVKYFERLNEFEQDKILKKFLGSDVKIDRLKFLNKKLQTYYKKDKSYSYGTISTEEILESKDLRTASVKQIYNEYGEIEEIKRIRQDEECEELIRKKLEETTENKLIEGTNVIDYSIENLKLDQRVYKCLYKAGIRNLSDIIEKDEDYFMQINEFGKLSFEKLLQVVHSHGVMLNEEIEKMEQEKELTTITNYEAIPNVRIEKLGMSRRTANALRRSGIMTLKQLLPKRMHEIAKTKNIGEKCCTEVIETIHKLGLKTRDEMEQEVIEEFKKRKKQKENEMER